MRTLTKLKTKYVAKDFARSFGAVCHVQVSLGIYSEQFKRGTLRTEYRVQCLHHAATTDAQDVIFVAASPRRIIYVMRITFDHLIMDAYRAYLDDIKLLAFQWIGRNAVQTSDDIMAMACDDNDGSEKKHFLHSINFV